MQRIYRKEFNECITKSASIAARILIPGKDATARLKQASLKARTARLLPEQHKITRELKQKGALTMSYQHRLLSPGAIRILGINQRVKAAQNNIKLNEDIAAHEIAELMQENKYEAIVKAYYLGLEAGRHVANGSKIKAKKRSVPLCNASKPHSNQ